MIGDRVRQDGLSTVLLSKDLLLDLALLARRDLDPVDNLIRLCVSQANVRWVGARADTQRQYACVERNPADDDRTPIRAAAVARTLGLPFETVRRRTARLCEVGDLRTTPRGLVVPASDFDAGTHLEVLALVETALRRAFEGLDRGGFFEPEDLPSLEVLPPTRPLRAAGRLAGDFYLRMLTPLRACAGDPVDAVMLLCLLRRWSPGPEAALTIRERSIRAADISHMLWMSPETARRRLQRMVADGLCQRSPWGYLVSSLFVEDTLAPRLAKPAAVSLRRLFWQLATLGLVTEWKARAAADLHTMRI